jgi:hypothetical protein
MADPLSAAPPANPDDVAPDYKPIAGLAVAAIIVAGLFALVVLGIAAAVVISGKPILQWGVLGIGLVAVGLGLAARFQITASEGTRAGTALANAAIGISAVFGVAYAAFLKFDELAVRAQTVAVCDEWFARLRADDVPGAFFWNLDPGQRTGLDRTPTDEAARKKQYAGLEARFGRTALASLRNSDLRSVLRRAGDKADVRFQGVRELTYEQTGYKVQLNYDVRTPEGRFDVVLSLASVDGKDFIGEERWHINLGGEGLVRGQKLTRLGRLLYELQYDGDRAAKEWVKVLSLGRTPEAYLATLSGDKRADLSKQWAESSRESDAWFAIAQVLGGLFPAARPGGTVSLEPLTAVAQFVGDADTARLTTLAGYGAFLREPATPADGEFRVTARPPLTEPAKRDAYRRLLLRPNSIAVASPMGPGGYEPTHLIFEPGKPVQVAVAVEMPPSQPGEGRVKGKVVTELRDAPILDELKTLATAENWATEKTLEDNTPSLLEKRPRTWQVIEVRTNNEPLPKPQGMPGGPPG